jgi:hypothetical protein
MASASVARSTPASKGSSLPASVRLRKSMGPGAVSARLHAQVRAGRRLLELALAGRFRMR